MAMGTPCISTDCAPGGAQALIDNGKNGMIVPVSDEVALVKGICYLADHPQTAKNIGELLCVFFGLIFSFTDPLLASQLLWINLVTDSLPAVSLGLDPEEKGIMDIPPLKNKSALLSKSDWVMIALEGSMIGALSLISGTVGNIFFGGIGRTFAFLTLSISQLCHAFNVRCKESSIKSGFFKNKALNYSVTLGVLLTVLLAKIPMLSKIFGISPLSFGAWIFVIFTGILPIVIMEIAKWFDKKFVKRS